MFVLNLYYEISVHVTFNCLSSKHIAGSHREDIKVQSGKPEYDQNFQQNITNYSGKFFGILTALEKMAF